jgi:hypothetical protein
LHGIDLNKKRLTSIVAKMTPVIDYGVGTKRDGKSVKADGVLQA